MRGKILTDFLKGIFIGILVLPAELLFLSVYHPVLAQENLGDQIRSQVSDPRDIRSTAPDPRDTVTQPCEIDPREGCARPVPRPSEQPPASAPAQSTAPSSAPSAAPSTGPQVSPSPAASAVPSPSSGIGGPSSPQPSSCPECEEEEGEGGTTTNNYYYYETKGPQVLGLSYTGSGKW